jgi:hypothetical protein
MSEQQDNKKVVEWSFSFEKVGDSINEQIRKMGIGDEEVKHDHFSAGLEGATSADVDLDLSVGRTTVQALQDSDSLIEADVAYMGEMRFEVSGDKEKKVRLGQKWSGNKAVGDALGKFVNREELHWEINLTPHIPLNLEINGGVGQNRLDLGGLNLSKLKLNSGVGETYLVLPATGSSYKTKVKSGVGVLRTVITEGAVVNLDIDGGVGSVEVQVPASAAVRVTVSSGLGGVSFPSHFRRVKGSSDFISQNGVWETEGFALASQQIRIEYRGGVGGFKATVASA